MGFWIDHLVAQRDRTESIDRRTSEGQGPKTDRSETQSEDHQGDLFKNRIIEFRGNLFKHGTTEFPPLVLQAVRLELWAPGF